jgi:hypothetical protein
MTSPRASDVARVLRDDGFTQSVPGTPTSVRSLDTRTEGFYVVQGPEWVTVAHVKGTRGHAARKMRMVGRYAEALRSAGYVVVPVQHRPMLMVSCGVGTASPERAGG